MGLDELVLRDALGHGLTTFCSADFDEVVDFGKFPE